MNTIILEGPDGGGKSTLASHLHRRGYTVVPFGVPPKPAQRSELSIFKFFFLPLYAHTHGLTPKAASPLVVFDRLHLSDAIYGPLMRGRTPMTPRVEALIERYVEAIDGQIVVCLPPRRVAFANWLARKGRGQEYVRDAKIFHRVYDGYARLLFNPKRNRNFLWYDYTRHRAESLARALAELQGNPLPRGVVGSQRPRFLFVGERPNGRLDLPFLDPGNCSGFLFDAIRAAGYLEPEVAFTNAFNAAGEDYLTSNGGVLDELIVNRNARLTVVALGEVAAAALNRSLGRPFHALPHPQYWKRFKARQRAEYVKRLADIRRRAR